MVGFSAITQILFVAKPGRQPINYYFCLGKMPPELLELPVKHHGVTRLVRVPAPSLNLHTKELLLIKPWS